MMRHMNMRSRLRAKPSAFRGFKGDSLDRTGAIPWTGLLTLARWPAPAGRAGRT